LHLWKFSVHLILRTNFSGSTSRKSAREMGHPQW
jgi:hypothetical protein